MIKVSVIVPVYNVSKYLDRCLNSLVNQTLKDIEIIIINDCSTDNSLDIINSYKEKYNNIILINNKKNMGIGYNRNKGMKIAKGLYIGFVDGDDWVDKTMFEKMYNKAFKDDLDVALCNYNKVDNEENILENDINIPYFENTNLKDKPDILLFTNLSPWNKIYKRGFIEDDMIFDEKLKYEDAIFTIKTLARADKIGMIEDRLNYYLVRDKSETTVVDKRVFDILEITKQIINELKSKSYYEEIKEYVEAFTVRNLFRYTLQQRYQKDKELKNKFIEETFYYLDNEFPCWRKNKIWKKRNILKRMIESSKLLTKIYCFLGR